MDIIERAERGGFHLVHGDTLTVNGISCSVYRPQQGGRSRVPSWLAFFLASLFLAVAA